jgi:DNA-binding GntR family transcriptional regulator
MSETATATAENSAAPISSMQDRVYDLLKSMIEDGRIRAGEKLLEVQVARAFGVSRSPARHALQALRMERLVRAGSGRGYVVEGRTLGANNGRLATLEEMPIVHAPRWERVYGEVEQALCTGVLHHTLRITEERLAEHFGVSRTVARDVLARMHSVGLLGKDRYGRWIAERVTPSRIRDLYEMRWLLEPQALLQSVPHIPGEQLERMHQRLVDTLAQLPATDSRELARLEDDIHIDLLSRCPNRALLNALSDTHLLLVSNQYIFDLYLGIQRDVMETALREHLAVIDLLQRGDTAGAANVLGEHLKASCGVWLQRFASVSTLSHPPLPPYLTPVDPTPPQ